MVNTLLFAWGNSIALGVLEKPGRGTGCTPPPGIACFFPVCSYRLQFNVWLAAGAVVGHVQLDLAEEHLILLAQRTGDDGEGVGDAVLRILEGQLCHRAQGRHRTVAVAMVHGVGAGGEGIAALTAVRGGAGVLAVHHVGGDGQDGGGGLAAAVGVVGLDVLHEAVHDVVGDLVHPVVVVAVLGEVALHRVVHHDAVLVPDGLYLGVLDGAQGVGHNGQTRNTGGEPAGDLLVVQGHLDALVAVLVVHVVDDVQGVHIHPGQPLHHVVEALHHVLVVQVLVLDGAEAGANLLFADLVHAAVDGVQQALGQIGAGAEELHLLAHTHAGHAAGDGVVVAVGHAHQVVVLILDGAGGDAHPGAVTLEVDGQPGGPEHGHVGFGGGAQVLQRMQVAEAHFGDQRPAVDAHAADGLGNPGGVAAEQGVVLGGTGELDQTQLHDEVVHHLLNLALGEGAVCQVALGVDVQEGAGAAQAHGGAVLLLHRGQIAEVQPLDEPWVFLAGWEMSKP